MDHRGLTNHISRFENDTSKIPRFDPKVIKENFSNGSEYTLMAWAAYTASAGNAKASEVATQMNLATLLADGGVPNLGTCVIPGYYIHAGPPSPLMAVAKATSGTDEV